MTRRLWLTQNRLLVSLPGYDASGATPEEGKAFDSDWSFSSLVVGSGYVNDLAQGYDGVWQLADDRQSYRQLTWLTFSGIPVTYPTPGYLNRGARTCSFFVLNDGATSTEKFKNSDGSTVNLPYRSFSGGTEITVNDRVYQEGRRPVSRSDASGGKTGADALLYHRNNDGSFTLANANEQVYEAKGKTIHYLILATG